MKAKKIFKGISNSETEDKLHRFLIRCYEDELMVSVTVEYEDPDLMPVRSSKKKPEEGK